MKEDEDTDETHGDDPAFAAWLEQLRRDPAFVAWLNANDDDFEDRPPQAA